MRVGIGDDAAVLEMLGASAGSLLVWTVDAQVDGTHFRTDWVSWEDVGWRSFMAAASDLAAMGAEPIAALSALVLAPSVDDEALDALARGQAAAAAEVGAPVVGGNLARGTETSITTTLLGRADRAGSCVPAHVRVTGCGSPARWGWQASGSRCSGEHASARMQDARHLGVRPGVAPPDRADRGGARARGRRARGDRHLGRPRARRLAARGGERRAGRARLARCARGRRGGAGGRCGRRAGREPAEYALYGGEDYALLAASPRELPGFVRIGTVEAHDAGARLLLKTAGGTAAIEPRGFDHFQ